MKEYAAGFIMIWVVVWIVAGFFGYLFADESRFRCHDGGFAMRVASGLVYGTAEPLRELWEGGKNAREILETIHDLPEFKPNEPESHLKGIFGAFLGYTVGSSLSFAQHAKTCAAPPASSSCRSEPKGDNSFRRWGIPEPKNNNPFRQLTLPCS